MSCRSSDWAISLACVLSWLLAGCATTAVDVAPGTQRLVDEVWRIVRDNFHDTQLNGVDWDAARDRCLRRISDKPSNAVEHINAMLSELHASHTRLYAPCEPSYYELLDIYKQVIGNDLRRIFPDGVVRYRRASEAGEDTWIEPLAAFMQATRSSVRVIERTGARFAYVHMSCWAGETFQQLLAELLNSEPVQSCDGLILDIRGGWGGAPPDAVGLFGCLSPTLELIARDGGMARIDAAPPSAAPELQWRKPVALVIDEGTRSGKEVFAFAFKSQRRGTIIGTTTAGAVLGGTPFLLSSGELLIVATHDVRVDGVKLEGLGVTPDRIIDASAPAASRDPDAPLSAAIDDLFRAMSLPGSGAN